MTSETPEPTENDSRNFPLDALLNLLEVDWQKRKEAEKKLANGDALRYRNLGTKAYLRLCRLFGVKPCSEALPKIEQLQDSIKYHRARLKKLKLELKNT